MKKITIRNIPDQTLRQVKIYAKKLRISQNAMIIMILDNFVNGKPGLPYEEIHLKLKYLEEMSDIFYFLDDWKTQTNGGKIPYPRPIDEIELGKPKKGI